MPVSEGRPIVRRFVIKRHKVTTLTKNPWVLRDRSRPAYLGHFATHALAITAVDRKLTDERGYVPSVAEIRERMADGGTFTPPPAGAAGASVIISGSTRHELDAERVRIIRARASIRERRS